MLEPRSAKVSTKAFLGHFSVMIDYTEVGGRVGRVETGQRTACPAAGSMLCIVFFSPPDSALGASAVVPILQMRESRLTGLT